MRQAPARKGLSRARRSTECNEVVRCRTGTFADAEPGTIPDQRCITACCTTSGKRPLPQQRVSAI